MRVFFPSAKYHIHIHSDASMFGRWNCQSSLCDWQSSLWTWACSVRWLAGSFVAAHPHTHGHTYIWASSQTSISCSVHVSLLVSRSVVLHLFLYFSLQFWPSVLQDASVSSVSLSTFTPLIIWTTFFQVLANIHTTLSASSRSYWQTKARVLHFSILTFCIVVMLLPFMYMHDKHAHT